MTPRVSRETAVAANQRLLGTWFRHAGQSHNRLFYRLAVILGNAAVQQTVGVLGTPYVR